MTLRKFFKLAVWFCISVFCILSIVAYYINFIYPDSRPPDPNVMKSFLIETKDEAWLQKRIEEGELSSKKLTQQRQELWEVEMQTHHKTLEACKSGNDAYRMKNSYECDSAWKKAGGYGTFTPYLKLPKAVYQERKFVDPTEFETSQGVGIENAILRGCRTAKTIRQARKIGCYY